MRYCIMTKSIILGCTMLVPVLAASHAAADTTATQLFEEIVVTAQKKTERLSETPLSVSVLSGEDLTRLGIYNFTDYASHIPGISFETEGAGQTQINIRGISAGRTVTPTVGIYIDDVPYGGSSASANIGGLALDIDTFDLQRIEVLRGPQGTIYGASAMGGVIKYVTNKPDLEEYSGSANGDISTTRYGGVNEVVQGVINAPIVVDKLAVKVGGYYRHDAGFIDNVAGLEDVNHSEVYGGKFDALLQPSDDLSVRLSAFGQNIDREGSAQADFSLQTGQPVFGDLDQSRSFAEPFRHRFRMIAGTVKYDFSGAELTSITSYQTARAARSLDFSALYGPLLAGLGLNFPTYGATIDTETKKFTEEVRLQNATPGKLEWLLGLYYTHERNTNDQQIQPFNADGTSPPLNLLTVSLPGTYREIAAFGDLTYHFTDQFDATVGVRIAQNKQSSQQIGSGLLISSQPDGRSKETVSTFLFNPKYKFSDHAMIYARVASGYRPGGPNVVALDPVTGAPLAPATFAADKLWSYAVGLKGAIADNKLSLDLSVFYIDWKDMQINAVRNGLGVLVNAGKARSQGIEATAQLRPVEGLNLGANFSYTDAKLVENSVDLGGIDGERLPDSPKFMTAFTADYSFPVGSNATGSLSGSFRYIGDRAASFDASPSSPQFHLPSYTITDLRAGISFENVNASLYVKNLFDERGAMSAVTAVAVAGGPAQVSISQPRTFGATVGVSF